jgi:ribonuclease D
MTKVALSMLSAYVRAVCHEEGLGHDLVGSTQRLRELLDYLLGESQERPLLLTGWREEFVGRRLADLLEGRSELHLSGWPHDLRLHVVSHPAKDQPSEV